jgi:hypothetical protein
VCFVNSCTSLNILDAEKENVQIKVDPRLCVVLPIFLYGDPFLKKVVAFNLSLI